VEGSPVDGGPDFGCRLDVETGDQVDLVTLVLADDVGMFGVLLVTVGEDSVADLQAVLRELLAIECRREGDEEIDVPVAGDPGIPGGGSHVDDIGPHREVRDGVLDPLGEGGDGRLEAVALDGRGIDAVANLRDDGLEGLGGRGVGPVGSVGHYAALSTGA
jgi:hypothetical protein